MRRSLWILSGIGAFLFGFGSVACAFDMINKIENNEPYIVNLYFHPITGIIFVVLLIIFLYPIAQKLIQRK